jgi:hypothetical protein
MAARWRLAYARGFTRMALCDEARKRRLPGRLLRWLVGGSVGPLIPMLNAEARARRFAARLRG